MIKYSINILIAVFIPLIVFPQIDEFEKNIIQYPNITTNSLDSAITFNFNSAIDSIPYYKRIFNFDESGNLLEYSSYSFNEWYYTWIGKYKVFQNFDLNNNYIFIHNLLWDTTNSDWYNVSKWEAYYDSNSKFIWGIGSDWSNVINDWVYTTKEERFYNSSAFIELKMNYSWSTNQNVWDYSNKSEYYYNNDTATTFSYIWNLGLNDWEYTVKHLNVSDGNSNVIEQTTWIWDNLINDWIISGKSEYTYDNYNNEILHMSYKWDTLTNVFVNNYMGVFEYDEQGHQLLMEQYNWDDINSEWDGSVKRTSLFSDTICADTAYIWDDYLNYWDYTNYSETFINQFGYEYLLKRYSWDSYVWHFISKNEYVYDENWDRAIDIHWIFDEFWKYDRKDYYYYSESMNISNNLLNDSFKVFPIPTSDKIFIKRGKYNNEKIQNAVIINSSGAEIMHFRISNSITSINIEHLSSGIYFLVIDIEKYKILKR